MKNNTKTANGEWSENQNTLSVLMKCWLRQLPSPATRKGYDRVMANFSLFLPQRRVIPFAASPDARDAGKAAPADLASFLHLPSLAASQIVAEWLEQMRTEGRSPETRNHALTALRSFTRYAREAGATSIELTVRYAKVQPYRNTAGCGPDGFKAMIGAARQHKHPAKAARDVALLMLLFVQGLRRSEIIALNIEDFDALRETLTITGKGRAQPDEVPITHDTAAALESWLAFRGAANQRDALFIGMRRGAASGRLTGDGLYKIVRNDLGTRGGVDARPHGLRHAAITTALELFEGNYREVRRFSRHASLRTIERYDDARRAHNRAVANKLAELAR
jgi:integrase/recombinase XerC